MSNKAEQGQEHDLSAAIALRDWDEQADQPVDFDRLGAVHIWRINLLQPEAVVQQLAQTLAEDEVQRAQRFRFEQDRRRFVVGRGQLRSILSHYLGSTPSSMQFAYSPKGKPSLAGLPVNLMGDALQFNISHSHELALCAISMGREVGIDVEYLRSMPEAESLAKRFFAEAEHALIQALPIEEQAHAFFRLWTAKEAYLKATGQGLGHPLDQVEIVPAQGSWALSEALSGWSMQSFVPMPDYLAALVVEE
jgi:4'-phosphopantetheinyl transferase